MGDFEPAARVTLATEPDFRIGTLRVSPAARRLSGPGGEVSLEPRWMEALVVLGRECGRMVTREELFRRCWGAVVGDDSLNRAIAGLRRAAARFGPAGFTIQTVKAAGYVLIAPAPAGEAVLPREAALSHAWDAWKRELPQVEYEAITGLEAVLAADPADAECWALLALLLRHAVENAPPAERGRFVQRCEAAVDRANLLCPEEPIAATALATLGPIFGDWTGRRDRLRSVLQSAPGCAPAMHELAVLEMSVGRPSAAIPLIESLLDRYPRAPTILYKRMYHLWVLGEFDELERVGARAVQLWPGYMAIVASRFWTLAFTGQLERAAAHLEESVREAGVPAEALSMHRAFLRAYMQRGEQGPEYRRIVSELATPREMGPVQANASLIVLTALGALDAAFDVAHGYYLGRGPFIIGLQHAVGEAEITNQFRRGTQPLFIPATAPLRADPRFPALMEEIGLAAHWRETGEPPDFHAGSENRHAAV